MPRGYLPILIFLAVAIAFRVVTIMVAKLIRPSNPFQQKLETYESERSRNSWGTTMFGRR